jgi:hypothetical protein
MTASDIRKLLVQSLAERSDLIFHKHDFSRTAKATFYRRVKAETCQIFDFSLAVRPAYSQEALAHIYPRIRLEMKDVSAVASKLIEGKPALLANAPEIVVNRPLEHFVPKSERVQWYVKNVDDFIVIVDSIASQFEKWAMPFFEDYLSAQDIIRGYEANDDRPRLQESWGIFVIAAYVLSGRFEDAFSVAETMYATPGARKKFAPIFVNLPRVCSSIPQ